MGCAVKLLSKISKVPMDGPGRPPSLLPSLPFSLSLYLSLPDSENIHFIKDNSCIETMSEHQQIQEADCPRGRDLILGFRLRASGGLLGTEFC